MNLNSNLGFSLGGFFCNKQIKYHVLNGKLDLNSNAAILADPVENFQLAREKNRAKLYMLSRH